MRVDVVVRTRNRPVLLKRALESITSQSHADITVVIVNDAGEPRPVDDLVAKLPNAIREHVRVIHNEVSGGREQAMNTGLAQGVAPLFAIHDDDDSWEPGFLASAVAHLESVPADAAVAVRTDVVHELLEGDTVTEVRREVLASSLRQVTLVDTLIRNSTPPISMVYRRRLLEEVGWIDGSLPVLADWEYNLRVLAHAPIGFLDGPVLAHWHHRNQTSGDASNSIVAASEDHRNFNLLVRDRYLRSLGGSVADLALPLLVAEYEERLRRELEHGFGSLHESVDLTLASTVNELRRQREDVVSDIESQARRIGELEALVRALLDTPQRRLAGRLKKVLRRGPQS